MQDGALKADGEAHAACRRALRFDFIKGREYFSLGRIFRMLGCPAGKTPITLRDASLWADFSARRDSATLCAGHAARRRGHCRRERFSAAMCSMRFAPYCETFFGRRSTPCNSVKNATAPAEFPAEPAGMASVSPCAPIAPAGASSEPVKASTPAPAAGARGK